MEICYDGIGRVYLRDEERRLLLIFESLEEAGLWAQAVRTKVVEFDDRLKAKIEHPQLNLKQL